MNIVAPVLKPTQVNTDFDAVLTQTLFVSSTQPILSFMYRAVQGSGDLFIANVEGESDAISRTVALTPSDWTHAWLDLSALNGQTVTLTFGFQNPAAPQQIYLDEISVGGTHPGVYSTFLPVVRR